MKKNSNCVTKKQMKKAIAKNQEMDRKEDDSKYMRKQPKRKSNEKPSR